MKPARKKPRLNARQDPEDDAASPSFHFRNLVDNERNMSHSADSQMRPYFLPNSHLSSALGGFDRSALGMDAVNSSAAMFANLRGQNQFRIPNPCLDPLLPFPGTLMADRTVDRWSMHSGQQRSSFDLPPGLIDQQRLALLRLTSLRGSSALLESPILGGFPGGGMFLNSTSSTRNPFGPATGRFASASTTGRPLVGNLPSALGAGIEAVAGVTSNHGIGARREISNSSLQRGGNIAGLDVDLALQSRSLLSESSVSSSGSAKRGTTTTTARSGTGGDAVASLLALPKSDESQPTPHYTQRVHVPLATDEDQNWLSEFLCFVRSELVEVFRANQDDVKSRNSSKKVCLGQVGIRCRFCAHLPLSARASRSSSYPSSISRIYQSLTMMLRDHFSACSAVPPHVKQRFIELKGKTSQGATDSKHYWVHSGHKLGLVDSYSGISVGDCTPGTTESSPPFGAPCDRKGSAGKSGGGVSSSRPVLLVSPEDRALVSNFLYTLLSHAQLVKMEESEKTGNRKSLPVDLPGIGCRHCCQSNRKGLCRLFPARRRRLGNKVNDLYEHIRRCTLCPFEVKEQLASLKREELDKIDKSVGEKEFYDRIWARMGHGTKEDD
jgi:hypothetical protein